MAKGIVTLREVVECAEEGCLDMLDEDYVAEAIREALTLLEIANTSDVDNLVQDGWFDRVKQFLNER